MTRKPRKSTATECTHGVSMEAWCGCCVYDLYVIGAECRIQHGHPVAAGGVRLLAAASRSPEEGETDGDA